MVDFKGIEPTKISDYVLKVEKGNIVVKSDKTPFEKIRNFLGRYLFAFTGSYQTSKIAKVWDKIKADDPNLKNLNLWMEKRKGADKKSDYFKFVRDTDINKIINPELYEKSQKTNTIAKGFFSMLNKLRPSAPSSTSQAQGAAGVMSVGNANDIASKEYAKVQKEAVEYLNNLMPDFNWTTQSDGSIGFGPISIPEEAKERYQQLVELVKSQIKGANGLQSEESIDATLRSRSIKGRFLNPEDIRKIAALASKGAQKLRTTCISKCSSGSRISLGF